MKDIIAVVGNCASGKSTLVNNLRSLGYNAVNVPQEHSTSKRLWRHRNADLLVMLSCTLEVARQRKPGFAWTAEQLEVQRQRLRFAREECDLYIDTDPLDKEQVVSKVVDLLERRRECDR